MVLFSKLCEPAPNNNSDLRKPQNGKSDKKKYNQQLK